MNSIRIRVIKTAGELTHHVQLSMDNLLWWTVESRTDFEECVTLAKELQTKFLNNWKTPKPTHILWKQTV